MPNYSALSKRVDSLEVAVTTASGKSKPFSVGVVTPSGKTAKVLTVNGPVVAANDCEPDFLIPYTLKCLLYPKRFKVLFGGRGSAKTRTVVAVLVEKARSRFERILCCREIQKSISASSKQEIEDEIERRGLDQEFKITDSQIVHLGTGSTFSFEGLFRNKTKIKGYAGATIVWVEEAEDVSRKSWDYLIPTIRAKGSEIWVTFNPSDKDAATWQHFCDKYVDGNDDFSDYEDERRFVVKINYDQNPWLTQELIDEREEMRERDYDRYLWIWEGEFWTRSEAQVFSGKWELSEFDEPEDVTPIYGADWGFARDPSALVRCYIQSECLYITHEAGGVGIELDDHRPLFLTVPGAHDHTIRGDCARPETISHLRKPWVKKGETKKTKGFRVIPAKKWPGSVEDGVEYVRSFKRIYIHPRCKAMAKEFAKYSYKVDPNTDDVLPKIVDDWNHYIDALRYALGPYIGGKSSVRVKDIL